MVAAAHQSTRIFSAHILFRSDSCDRAVDRAHRTPQQATPCWCGGIYLCCAMWLVVFSGSAINRGRCSSRWRLGLTVPPRGRLHLPLPLRGRQLLPSSMLAQFVCPDLHAPALRAFPDYSTRLQLKCQKRRSRQLHGRHDGLNSCTESTLIPPQFCVNGNTACSSSMFRHSPAHITPCSS